MAERNDSQYAAQSDDVVPVPDPTRLTTQLVDRALAAFREVVYTRLGGMDKATELIATDLVKIEGAMDGKLAAGREFILATVENVRAVSGEKFDAIAIQFKERDTRTEQAAQESRISLDAALAAAKEAVSEQNKANALAIGKSEDATKERLDALAVLMTNSVRSLEDKIADLKGRFDRGEGRGTGETEARLDARTVLFAVVGLLIASAGLAIAFLR